MQKLVVCGLLLSCMLLSCTAEVPAKPAGIILMGIDGLTKLSELGKQYTSGFEKPEAYFTPIYDKALVYAKGITDEP